MTDSTDNDRPMPITIDEARAVAIAAQRLDLAPRPTPPTKHDILELIRALGCVQLDTISVVARSHETVLWSRLGPYDAALIGELYDPDRQLAEYWAHAAAIVPIELLPLFRRRMASYRDPDSRLHAYWDPDHELNRSILETIAERGPLPSRAFERPDGPRPAAWSWWGGKPTSKALDFLWTAGELVIRRRERGFQRVYDLTERLHPMLHADPLPDEAEQRRQFVARALAALGVATPRWVADYFRTGGQAHVSARDALAELKALECSGEAWRVAVPGVDEPTWLADSRLPLLDALRSRWSAPERTTLLSPFDNLVWHRERALRLFAFDYRLESYTPAAKRRYGYYTLPILHRGALVGRLDPSYDRKRRVLTVKAVHLEPGVVVTRSLTDELAASLRSYTTFLGGGSVVVLASAPPELATDLARALG